MTIEISRKAFKEMSVIAKKAASSSTGTTTVKQSQVSKDINKILRNKDIYQAVKKLAAE